MRIPFTQSAVAATGCRGIVVIAFFCCLACGRTERPSGPPPLPETPKALQDKSSSTIGEIKSRGGGDLVESLYRELVTKDSALKDLEGRLDVLSDHHKDSTRPFEDFDSKNNAYYASAMEHIKNMKDSLLRGKMEQLIAASDTAYRKMTAGHHTLLATMDMKQLSVEDLHTMLKLTRTAVVIGQYQKGHLPGTSPLQHVLKEYEQAERKTEAMIPR